jgi:hypothetical protein
VWLRSRHGRTDVSLSAPKDLNWIAGWQSRTSAAEMLFVPQPFVVTPCTRMLLHRPGKSDGGIAPGSSRALDRSHPHGWAESSDGSPHWSDAPGGT